MTDFTALLLADRGQPARPIHLIDKGGFVNRLLDISPLFSTVILVTGWSRHVHCNDVEIESFVLGCEEGVMSRPPTVMLVPVRVHHGGGDDLYGANRLNCVLVVDEPDLLGPTGITFIGDKGKNSTALRFHRGVC